MKKWLVLMIALLMAVTLTAYGGDPPQKNIFPTGPVKLLVTHGPGGITDQAARGLAPYLSKALGVPVPVENVEGGGGRTARARLFREKPDGYNLLATGMPSTQVGELLEKGNYKTMNFTYFYNVIGSNPRIILVPKDSPFKDFKSLLAQSQKNELLAAGSGGKGSAADVQSKLLSAKVNLKHRLIPFNSDAEALIATLGKQADFLLVNLGGVVSAINNGQVRILAVHSEDRIKQIEDVPTMKELGFNGVSILTIVGIVGPPSIPDDVQKVIADAMKKALADPGFVAWADKASLVVEPLDPVAFKKLSQDMYDQVKNMLPLLEGEKKK